MNATCAFAKDLQPLSYRVNSILKHADSKHFEQALLVREAAKRAVPSYAAISAVDPLVYEGREVLVNRMSYLHTDRQDPPWAFAVMAAAGYHKGGYCKLPHLGIRIRFEPGDIILLRGHVVPHEIEDWIGQRITIPHFTHLSMWRAMKNYTVFEGYDLEDPDSEDD